MGGAVGALLVGTPGETNAAPTTSAGEAWLDELAGKPHKVFLDVGVFATDLGALRRTRALITALRESYGAADRDIGIAFGAHGSGLGYVLSAAAWDSLGLVDLVGGMNLRAAETTALKGATRNWGAAAAESVVELRQRGVRFLACRNTITRLADRIANLRKTSSAVVMQEVVAGLHPGVEPVPAMIASAVLAQERKLSYLAIT